MKYTWEYLERCISEILKPWTREMHDALSHFWHSKLKKVILFEIYDSSLFFLMVAWLKPAISWSLQQWAPSNCVTGSCRTGQCKEGEKNGSWGIYGSRKKNRDRYWRNSSPQSSSSSTGLQQILVPSLLLTGGVIPEPTLAWRILDR